MTLVRIFTLAITLPLGAAVVESHADTASTATTQPASAVITSDGSTTRIDGARQCLRNLVKAVLAEDSDQLRAMLEPERAELQPLADALVESWTTSARLSRVAAASFGEAIADGLLADDPDISTRTGWTTGVLDPLPTAPVTVQDDGIIRIVTEPESTSPWRLRATDGQWRVLVSAEFGYDIDRGVRDLKTVAERHTRIANDIESGTIKGPPALRDRVRAEVQAANMGADLPTATDQHEAH